MAAVKTKRTPPPDEPYTNIEMRLICASKIKIVNGEHAGTVINWDSDMLRVYLYLFNQVKGFENNSGEFYQSQDKIRLSTGIGKTKLNEVLGVLKKLGLIQPTGKKAVKGAPRGLVKYTASRLMDVIGNLEIIFADDNGEPVWDHDRASGRKSKKKQDDGKSNKNLELQAATADQNVDLASEPAPDDSGQRDSVASNDDNGGNDGSDGDHAVSQVGEQEDHFPWRGDTFIKNRLSENAYQWALTAGATDWRHACCLVWEKIELTPPTEIDEHFKPLSLC